MRHGLLVIVAGLIGAFPGEAHAGYLDLTVDNCANETSVQDVDFSGCTTSTKFIVLQSSFKVPQPFPNFFAAVLRFEIEADPPPLRPFWHFEPSSGCNSSGLTVNCTVEPSSGPCNTETSPWGHAGSQAAATITEVLSPGSPGALVVTVDVTRSAGMPFALVPGVEYYACTLVVNSALGASCAGCGDKLSIVLHSVTLFSDDGSQTTIGGSGAVGNCVRLNGETNCINQYSFDDADGDGYGDPERPTFTTCGNLCATNNLDCDDTNAAVHPGAVEICGNGIDDNCNGVVDEGSAFITSFSPPFGSFGSNVVISGSGLAGTTGVLFNGMNAPIVSNTGTSITATVPAGSTAGPIGLVKPCGTSTSTTDFYPPGWPSIGVPVSRAAMDQLSPVSIPDGSGGVIVAWKDHRGADYDIYAQRMNANGQPLWAVGGVAVCTAPDDQISPVIVSDGAQGAIIAWDDHRSSTYVYAQRITAVGTNANWGNDANGVRIEDTQAVQPAIASDGQGGAIVTWSDLRNPAGADIYARLVDSSGMPQWAANGVPVCLVGSLQQSPVIIPDGAHGAIVSWMDYRAGLDIYAQRLDVDGNRLWTNPNPSPNKEGVPVCTASGDQNSPVMVADGTAVPNGAIVAWEDHRSSTHIYAQRITAAGTNANWDGDPNGVELGTTQEVGPAIATDGAGGAIVAWSDLRNEPSYGDIYGQRVNSLGARQWGTNGLPISQGVSLQQLPSLMPDGANGAIICWWDYRAGLDIYAQHVNGSGERQWPYKGGLEGVPVGNAVGDQDHSSIVPDATGGAIVTWQDARAGAGNRDIYAVRVRSNGLVTAVPPAASQDVAPALAWPNPFNSRVSIAFNLSQATPVHIEVEDVAGRRVWSTPTQSLPAGRHSLAWSGETDAGTAAAAGIYFLRVSGAGIAVSRPVIRTR